VLLDDEIPGLTYLKMLCDQVPELDVIKAFDNPQTFISKLPETDFDLCILDIEMPTLNGLQVANLLKDKLIIFTTAYKEFAADAFDLDAVDYVRKPVQKDRLQQAVKKALARHASKEQLRDFVQLNSDKGKALLYFNLVGYIKSSDTDSRDKVAMFIDGSSIVLKNISFENLLKVLPPSRFCRISKREVVSMKIVNAYSYDEITTSMIASNGQPVKLSLSESYRPDFLRFADPVL
jgi:DNA-binding LytR/AlgR family response regulator